MKAITLVRQGAPETAFEVRDMPEPEPREGQVQIRVDAFGLNFADVMARLGLYQEAPRLPFVPGYEVVGRVTKVGPGVSAPAKGQRVVGFTRFGGYAEYVTTPAQVTVPIPDRFSNAVGAALGTQYCTAYYAACEAAQLFPGERVLIHAAAGGVGTALVQLARLKGCEIFGTAGSAAKLDYLRQLGVHYPINYRTQSFASEVRRILGGPVLDVAFDSLGGRTYRLSNALLGTGGRMVSYGVAEMSGRGNGLLRSLKLFLNFRLLHPVFLILKSKSAIGVNMLKIADDKPHVLGRCLRAVVQMASDGQLAPPPGTTFKVNQIAEAHRLLEDRTSKGKLVVEW